MALVGFKNTNNQVVYVNTDQVLYITTFEPDVSIIAFAVAAPSGHPAVIHVRGSVELVHSKMAGLLPQRGREVAAG